jgi:hypothetical protein
LPGMDILHTPVASFIDFHPIGVCAESDEADVATMTAIAAVRTMRAIVPEKCL